MPPYGQTESKAGLTEETLKTKADVTGAESGGRAGLYVREERMQRSESWNQSARSHKVPEVAMRKQEKKKV